MATSTNATPVIAHAPIVAPNPLRDIVMPADQERVIFVPQHSYQLVDLADDGGLVGRPATDIEPLMTKAYGAPFWHTWRADYGHHQLGLGMAVLVVRDGLLRRGPQRWDSSD